MSDARLVPIGDHAINVLSHGEGERHFTCLHGLVDTLEPDVQLRDGALQRKVTLCAQTDPVHGLDRFGGEFALGGLALGEGDVGGELPERTPLDDQLALARRGLGGLLRGEVAEGRVSKARRSCRHDPLTPDPPSI